MARQFRQLLLDECLYPVDTRRKGKPPSTKRRKRQELSTPDRRDRLTPQANNCIEFLAAHWTSNGFRARPCVSPTTIAPGPGKIDVLAERYLAGEDLWHAHDAPGARDPADVLVALSAEGYL